jgi:hypothetical protein
MYCVGFWSTILEARVMLKNRTLHYTEELINGRKFSHRQEFVEGVHKNIWKVDGEVIDRETYDELILDGEREERRQERKCDYDEQVADYLFRHEAQRSVIRKLLKAEIDSIKQEIGQLIKYNLEEYVAFSGRTIKDKQEYVMLVQELIPQAEALVSASEGEPSEYQALVQMHGQLEPYQDKVKAFVQDTVSSAIERCDDTRFLKELLGLVS